jgi:hypothetical protein
MLRPSIGSSNRIEWSSPATAIIVASGAIAIAVTTGGSVSPTSGLSWMTEEGMQSLTCECKFAVKSNIQLGLQIIQQQAPDTHRLLRPLPVPI